MRRILFILVVTLLVFPSAAASAGTAYGSGVTLEQATRVSDILTEPGAYAGKTVKVTGLVVDVCTARGCWLDLAGDKPYETIRVKVEDGAIVFPASARGRRAAVQGKVEMMAMCPDEAQRYRRKEAEAKGIPFDPASVTGKEAAMSIRATGAVIE